MFTLRKKLYAEGRVLHGLNMKQAAIAAGCPEKTAKQAGSRMEKDPDVIAAMGRIVASEPLPDIHEYVPVVREKLPPEPRPVKQPNLPDPSDVYIPRPVPDADPLKFLAQVMNDCEADPKLRIDAAKALASYTVMKPGEKGKKEMKEEEAKIIASKFKPQRLKAV